MVGSFGAVTAIVLARKWSRMKPAGGAGAAGGVGNLHMATAGAGAGGAGGAGGGLAAGAGGGVAAGAVSHDARDSQLQAHDSQLEERLADELRDLD